MLPVSAKALPQRSIIWDEENARYVFLDPAAKIAAMNIRAKRAAALFAAETVSLQPCALGAFYNSRDYDDGELRGRYVRDDNMRFASRMAAKRRGRKARSFGAAAV